MANIKAANLLGPASPPAKEAIVVAKGNTLGMKVINAVDKQHVKSRPT